MASLVGGRRMGASKAAQVIPVRWEEGDAGFTQAVSLFDALLWILEDVRLGNMQRKAILNYSGGRYSMGTRITSIPCHHINRLYILLKSLLMVKSQV
jgi:hypothetical protein